MLTTKLSTKGQVTIPKEIRSTHGWSEGLEFTILETENGLLLIPLPLFEATVLSDVIGSTGYTGASKSLQEMEAAIAKGVQETS